MSISDLIHPSARFLRTAHVGRDYGNDNALANYVPTPHVLSTVGRIARSLRSDTQTRAWRVTGDYGSGKSSLALALAHAFSGDVAGVPREILEVCRDAVGEAPQPRLVPVLITGEREPLAHALMRGVRAARELAGLTTDVGTAASTSDADAAAYLEKTWQEVSDRPDADGVLLVIDELGKLLEYASLHPDRHDIQLLQTVAEMADRSGEAPLVVIGLLHQGFTAYAESLTRTAKDEWEKVAGRYGEIVFRHPLEELAVLAGGALGVDATELAGDTVEVAQHAMEESVRLGWYGPGVSQASLIENAPSLYPLHPTVLPVLAQAVRLYGQNERTLFSFLLAPEPAALPEFAATAEAGQFFGLAELYDYVATTFGHRISARSARSHWSAISALIDTVDASEDELAVLKAIGLLNLLITDRYLATEEALVAAFEGSGIDALAVLGALRRRGFIFDRGARGGFCLWPHSSVDLEAEFQRALEAARPVPHVGRRLAETVTPAPVVARRHYIETGTLRAVEVRYTAVEDMAESTATAFDADALLVVALSDTEVERAEALEAAAAAGGAGVTVVVPRPLSGLRDVLREVDAWRYVIHNTPGLAADAFAAEEASRQVEAAQSVLSRRLDDVLGFTKRGGVLDANWFYSGASVELKDSRAVLAHLSEVCSRVYYEAPCIDNELINRAEPSSAAVGARSRLIERILTTGHEPSLGFPKKAFPPEKAMYLSVLKKGRLHREVDGVLGLHLPEPEADPANLRPTFGRMREVLEEADLAKVPIDELFAELVSPPYGVRSGLLHLLLAVFYRIYERDVALYEAGVFVHRPTPQHFHRLAKDPSRFALQLCPVDGVRADLFSQLLSLVEIGTASSDDLAVLDVVRPLAVFAAGLPEHTQKTRIVSTVAQRVRAALLESKEPAPLLFEDLPQACGVRLDDSSETTSKFVDELRLALDELRAATPELRTRVANRLAEAFDLGSAMDDDARRLITSRADALLGAVRDRDLRALIGRLADTGLPLDRWVDAVASLVAAKPLERWTDDDEVHFGIELASRVAHFCRTEAAVFTAAGEGDGAPALGAVRFGVTEADGSESSRILVIREDESARLESLVEEATAVLNEKGRLERIALIRALGLVLGKEPGNASVDQ